MSAEHDFTMPTDREIVEHVMPSDKEIVDHVENGVEYLWNGLSNTFSEEFSDLIKRCMEVFHTLEWTRSGYDDIQVYKRITMQRKPCRSSKRTSCPSSE